MFFLPSHIYKFQAQDDTGLDNPNKRTDKHVCSYTVNSISFVLLKQSFALHD